jgi:hypothetical protein
VAPINKYGCHTRESGYPVIAGGDENLEQHGVLDHPPSRMMTSEAGCGHRRFHKPGNDE